MLLDVHVLGGGGRKVLLWLTDVQFNCLQQPAMHLEGDQVLRRHEILAFAPVDVNVSVTNLEFITQETSI